MASPATTGHGSSSGRLDGEPNRPADDETIKIHIEQEMQSLFRVIAAYINYPDASERTIQRWERSYARLPPPHKALLSHLPSKFQAAREGVRANCRFVTEMLQAFDPPFPIDVDHLPPPTAFDPHSWQHHHHDHHGATHAHPSSTGGPMTNASDLRVDAHLTSRMHEPLRNDVKSSAEAEAEAAQQSRSGPVLLTKRERESSDSCRDQEQGFQCSERGDASGNQGGPLAEAPQRQLPTTHSNAAKSANQANGPLQGGADAAGTPDSDGGSQEMQGIESGGPEVWRPQGFAPSGSGVGGGSAENGGSQPDSPQVVGPPWLPPAVYRQAASVPVTDADKVRCVLRNIVRDWAAEAAEERRQCFGPILAELRRKFAHRLVSATPSAPTSSAVTPGSQPAGSNQAPPVLPPSPSTVQPVAETRQSEAGLVSGPGSHIDAERSQEHQQRHAHSPSSPPSHPPASPPPQQSSVLGHAVLPAPVPSASPSFPPPRCLVPGAGLGRLALEIAALGFECQGNDFSFYVLVCSSFLLNCSERAGQWRLHPWLLSSSNVVTDGDQLAAVAVPDVVPALAGVGDGFSMCAGDFVEVYGHPEHEGAWDAVATCFFIDTARNVVRYLEILSRILRPGGVWVNLGPLLYHYADALTPEGEKEMSVELSVEDVRRVAEAVGFAVEREERVRATYTANPQSMMHTEYNCVLWTMVKRDTSAPPKPLPASCFTFPPDTHDASVSNETALVNAYNAQFNSVCTLEVIRRLLGHRDVRPWYVAWKAARAAAKQRAHSSPQSLSDCLAVGMTEGEWQALQPLIEERRAIRAAYEANRQHLAARHRAQMTQEDAAEAAALVTAEGAALRPLLRVAEAGYMDLPLEWAMWVDLLSGMERRAALRFAVAVLRRARLLQVKDGRPRRMAAPPGLAEGVPQWQQGGGLAREVDGRVLEAPEGEEML